MGTGGNINDIGDLADGFYIQGPNGSDPGSNVSVKGDVALSVGGGISLGFASALLNFTGELDASISVGLNANGGCPAARSA